MCMGRQFQIDGAETEKADKEKLPVIPDGLARRFVMEECKDLDRTHTHLTALFPGLPGQAGTRKVNQSGFYRSKTVSSSGVSWATCKYASLHLAPDR